MEDFITDEKSCFIRLLAMHNSCHSIEPPRCSISHLRSRGLGRPVGLTRPRVAVFIGGGVDERL